MNWMKHPEIVILRKYYLLLHVCESTSALNAVMLFHDLRCILTDCFDAIEVGAGYVVSQILVESEERICDALARMRKCKNILNELKLIGMLELVVVANVAHSQKSCVQNFSQPTIEVLAQLELGLSVVCEMQELL